MVERIGGKKMNEILNAMCNRKSAREFSQYKATDLEIEQIVESVRRTPSSKNTQPWLLYLLQDYALEQLKKNLCNNFDNACEPNPELDNSLLSIYKPQAVALGKSIFAYKGIAREDYSARRLHDRANFELFNAPQAFVLGISKLAHNDSTILDCGIFLGYLLLAIESMGFSSCPQASPLIYPDALRKVIPNTQDVTFVCVIPFGKPLLDSHINAFNTPRELTETWFTKI